MDEVGEFTPYFGFLCEHYCMEKLIEYLTLELCVSPFVCY